MNTSSATANTAIQMVSKSGGNAQSSLIMVKQSPGVSFDFSCAANAPSSPCRWGDFCGASPDPVMTSNALAGFVWLSAEYNLASAAGSTGTDWRTWNWSASWAPTDLKATGLDGVVDLTWTAPAAIPGSEIDGYNIYRSTTQGTECPGIPVASSLTPSYHDDDGGIGLANGTAYSYVVTAVYSGAATTGTGETAPSNEASATPHPVVAPDAPTNLKATALRGAISLSWTAPANDGGAPVTEYRIYRSASSGGPFAQIATVSGSPPPTSYQNTITVKGTYFYEVTAWNAFESAASNTAGATVKRL